MSTRIDARNIQGLIKIVQVDTIHIMEVPPGVDHRTVTRPLCGDVEDVRNSPHRSDDPNFYPPQMEGVEFQEVNTCYGCFVEFNKVMRERTALLDKTELMVDSLIDQYTELEMNFNDLIDRTTSDAISAIKKKAKKKAKKGKKAEPSLSDEMLPEAPVEEGS